MTTQPIPSATDDLIAEIEAEAKALEWTGKWYSAGCGTVHCDYRGQFTDDGHGEVAHPEPIGAASYIACASPANVLTLIARIRELEQAQRWVPCSERLPEMEGDASTESAVVQIFFDDPNQNSGLIKAGFYCYEEQAWYLDYGNAVLHEFDEDPTHWKPLTEPPK